MLRVSALTTQVLYVGDLAGFDWNGNWDGNLPRRLTSDFPPVRSGSQRKELEAWVNATGLPYAQTDFDA